MIRPTILQRIAIACLSLGTLHFGLSPAIAQPVPKICPSELKTLSKAIAKDLPSYLTRTYTRLGFKRQIITVSLPELEPLPLAKDRSPSPNDPQQVFFSVLERQPGKVETSQRAYWLFISDTKLGWRLSMAFTRISNAPPEDVSDGAIANAVSTWLKEHCTASNRS
ncbi:hypothetical protein V2H45_05495 [Tumidithrix elongata RA019]|uniref:Uncharacterized protein n=1 Tax=Tumidithrix elongata BACA0141 TaxID=2716417 RepID=A0AAW9PZ36_9CYAN|nr:hypothetical protein [Tumidithrix elongata RA019]